MPQVKERSLIRQTQQLAAQADWAQVVVALQQVCQGQARSATAALDQLPEPEQAAWLDLAMQVFEQGDFQLRWDVGKLLPHFDRAAMTALLELLRDPTIDPDVHWFAVRSLADFPDPAIMPILIETIQTTDSPELQQVAAQVLGQMGLPVLPLLKELLEQPSSRPIGVQILAQMRHPAAIGLLFDLAQDDAAATRATAIDALSGFHSPAIAQRLCEALQDKAQVVRLMAIRSVGFCLADLPDCDWLAAIQPLLHDLDPAVCRQAALTLGRLGTSGAIAALVAVLQAPLTPEPLAIDVIRSLCWMEQAAAVAALAPVWASTLSAPRRQAMCEHLGRIETPAPQAIAVDQLMLWLADDRLAGAVNLRQAMITALGGLGDPRAIDLLIQQLPQAEPRLRLHLIAALKQIDPNTSGLLADFVEPSCD